MHCLSKKSLELKENVAVLDQLDNEVQRINSLILRGKYIHVPVLRHIQI
jgi:hypothetical protein